MYRASSGMPGSSKNVALELERVYTPRSVAAIQAALSTLDDKLASGNTQHNLPACEPLIALQRRGECYSDIMCLPNTIA